MRAVKGLFEFPFTEVIEAKNLHSVRRQILAFFIKKKRQKRSIFVPFALPEVISAVLYYKDEIIFLRSCFLSDSFVHVIQPTVSVAGSRGILGFPDLNSMNTCQTGKLKVLL